MKIHSSLSMVMRSMALLWAASAFLASPSASAVIITAPGQNGKAVVLNTAQSPGRASATWTLASLGAGTLNFNTSTRDLPARIKSFVIQFGTQVTPAIPSQNATASFAVNFGELSDSPLDNERSVATGGGFSLLLNYRKNAGAPAEWSYSAKAPGAGSDGSFPAGTEITAVKVIMTSTLIVELLSGSGPVQSFELPVNATSLQTAPTWRIGFNGVANNAKIQLNPIEIEAETDPYLNPVPGNQSSWQGFQDTFEVELGSLEGFPVQLLELVADSSAPSVIPPSSLSVTRSAGDLWRVTLNPPLDAKGTSTITLRATLGGGTLAAWPYQHTIEPNVPPTISQISTGLTAAYGMPYSLPFSARSERWPANRLTFQITAPPDLVKTENIFIQSVDANGNYRLVITPEAGPGTGTVTVAITDPIGDRASTSFPLTVAPFVRPPVVLGAGSALALNPLGRSAPQPRQYVLDSNASDTGTGATATLEAWVFATSLPDTNLNVVSMMGRPGKTQGVILAVQGDGSPSLANWLNDFYPTNATIKITTNRWHHLAGVVNGQSVSLYVDGQLSAAGTLPVAASLQAGMLMVGLEPASDNLDRPWCGYLDNLRFWSTARSAQQIADNFLRQVPPDAPGLLRDFRAEEGFLHFDGGNPAWGTTAYPSMVLLDSSSAQRHAPLIGLPAFVPGVATGYDFSVEEDAPLNFGLASVLNGAEAWGSAGALREIFFGPVNSALGSGLGASPGWPDRPDTLVSAPVGLEVAPGGQSAYGQRIRGWLVPPETGTYTFAIASVNEGQLWLSTDDSTANLQRIASSPASGVGFRQFDLNPVQQSAKVNLTQGRRYYFEVRHQADSGANGGAHLSVRWIHPSGLTETPIPAARIIPVGTAPAGQALTYTIQSPPDAGTLVITNGQAAYTPHPNYYGPDSFIYTAAYAGLTSAPVVVNLNIVNRDDAPVAGTGSGLRFGGSKAGASANVEFNLNQQSFTVELWARRGNTTPPGAESLQLLWHLAPDLIGGTNSQALFGWRGNGQVFFETAPLLTEQALTTATAYLDTDWHHWAAVFDATTGKREIFRDGISLGQDITTNAPLVLARLHLAAAYGFIGGMDVEVEDVRLWTMARTADQIIASKGTPLTGREDNLYLYYRMNEENGLVAHDSSPPKPGGNRIDMTLANPVTWTAGSTNLSTIPVPRNSPGQRIFLPAFDPEGQTLTWQIISPTPANGRLLPVPTQAGAYTYIPFQNFKGDDLLQYQVTAGGRTSTVATVILKVDATPIPPVIQPIRDQELEEEDPALPLSIVLSDVDDPTGASLRLRATSSNGTLLPVERIVFTGSGNVRTATLEPVEGEVGVTTVEIEVSNGILSAATVFQVRVNPSLAYVPINTAANSGWTSGTAAGLNELGQLAGWVSTTTGPTNSRPFFYAGYAVSGTTYVEENLGGSVGAAFGVNNAGLLVGAAANSLGALRAFAVDPVRDTKPTDLGVLAGGNLSVARAVNSSGLVVGYSDTEDRTFRAFTAGNGPLTALALTNGFAEMWATAVNDDGEIAGYARRSADNATNAFLSFDGLTQDLGRPDGASHVVVTAIDEDGVVFGHGLYAAGARSRAVMWADGIWTDLGDILGGGAAEVTGANRYRQIVGRALTTNGVWHGFVFNVGAPNPSSPGQAGRAFDLNSLSRSETEWVIESAAAINDRGQIAATGRIGSGDTQPLLLFPATEIGRRVFRPEGATRDLPQITILEGNGHDEPGNSFFWSTGERKLFAIRPVVAEIRWRTGVFEVTTNLTEFGENLIRQKVTNEVTLPTLSFNVWPADPDIHVVGTPVQVQPDQPGFQHGFHDLIYRTSQDAEVNDATKVFTSTDTGYSVLHYLRTGGRPINVEQQPHEFRVTRSVHWDDPQHVVKSVPWEIGAPLTNVLHQDYPGLNGYVLFPVSPYDGAGPLAAHDRATRTGPILPVNTVTGTNEFVVVWYQQNPLGVSWSSLPRSYVPSWPAQPDTLVIASQLGSGMLSAAEFPNMQVYHQDDDTLPGFNPNEEHALILSGILYALRNDLNDQVSPKASDPYVLLKHRDPVTAEWRMKVYGVVAERAPYFFRYEGVAGREIQPPLPLSLLPLMNRSNRVYSGPAWQDYDARFYARSAGGDGGEADVVMQYFYPLQPGFFYDLARDGRQDLADNAPVPWLAFRSGSITGDPVNVVYAIEWPANVPALQVGQSLTSATGGLPDITDMAAAQVVFDSLDPDGTQPITSAARLYDPLSPRTVPLGQDFEFPTSVRREVDPSTGLESFPDLPDVLRLRVFHDGQARQLGFRGYVYTPTDGGASITLVNVMSTRERETITQLDTSGSRDFKEAVDALFTKTRNPNDVDTNRDGKPDEALLIGLTTQVVTNGTVVSTNVVRETVLGPKALTAGQPIAALNAPTSPALRFAGGDDALFVGPKFTNITDTFTMEFWVRPAGSRAVTAEELTGASGLNGQQYAIFPTQGATSYGPGHAGTGVSVGTNGVSVFMHSDYLLSSLLVHDAPLTNWHHVAVVFVARQPVLYLDGVQVRVGQVPTLTLHPSADLSRNATTGGGYGPFSGSLSDVRVWNYARTANEIASNFNRRLTGSESGLTGLWRFSEGTGTTTADAGPNHLDGTLSGNPTWEPNGPVLAPAPRYVVVAENNDPTLGGLPVSLHVIEVVDTLSRGNLAILEPANVLDQRVTLRHSADFAGQPESFVFEWYYQLAEGAVLPGSLPGDAEGTGDNAWIGYPGEAAGRNDITLGTGSESGLLTLSDTWWLMRYGIATANGTTNWSGWIGDPSGTAAAPRPMLVPGWIKRVLAGLNLFAQRSSDFSDTIVNTLGSTLAEAGPRYEGDVALNPSVLDQFGLIEIYETILRRGKSLSIDGAPPVNSAAADDALLLAAGRIAELYLLHANEAFADSADPTIGLTTDSTELGSMASSIFAFENQVDSLLEEELVMLRGRDDTSGGTGAAPVYNRFLWNFTGGEGETAYVAKYGIPDQNGDGFITALDARILFPQGHGDAWGHYLTALTTYYDLLGNDNFTWNPRSQATLVAGIAIEVNYQDERRFAQAAAAKARTGAEIVDRTWRLDYSADPVAQFQGNHDPNFERSWSTTDWARRAALGAYFDWVTGNAILPPVDPNPDNTGIRRVDRTTVLDLVQVVSEAGTVLNLLDRADAGLNPLGLAPGVVPFDIDPDQLRTGFSRVTHFEQVYGRAVQALQNAETTFNRATALSSELRKQQNSLSDYSVAVASQETDFRNQLIALFGYPHAGNIGAGRPYATGYDGPDTTFWMYIDTLDATRATNPTGQEILDLYDTFTRLTVNWGATFSQGTLDVLNPPTNSVVEVDYPVYAGNYAFETPAAWGKRRAEGQLQSTLRQLVLAQAQFLQASHNYSVLAAEIRQHADLLDLRYGLKADQIKVLDDKRAAFDTLNGLIAVAEGTRIVASGLKSDFEEFKEIVTRGIPDVEGLSFDGFAIVKSLALLSGQFAASVPGEVAEVAEGVVIALEFSKEITELELEKRAEVLNQEFEVKEQLKDLESLVREEPSLRLDIFNATQALRQAARDLEAQLAEAQRLIVQRTVFRQVTAGTIQASRYRDLGLRIFRNDALQKYDAQFELASRYVQLAAAAYDYELNLGTDSGAGGTLASQIVRERNLGELVDGEPVVGRVGLATLLGRLRQNFDVLKGQLGLNNDRQERSRFSLRAEAFRHLPPVTNNVPDTSWSDRLRQSVVSNLWDVAEFRRYCRPFAPESAGPQPGIVLRFGTTIAAGRNFFDRELGPLDSSYDPSEFSTRIRSLAVWFSNYDTAGLAAKPRVYLVPVGTDRLRSSDSTDQTIRDWQIVEQRIPVPYPLTAAGATDSGALTLLPSADGSFTDLRRHSAFPAHLDAAFDPDEFTESSRLVGRSVWNTQWVLIIPGAYLLWDANDGLDRFIEAVDDIKLYFQTYSASGN